MHPDSPLAPYVGDASATYHQEKRAIPPTALPWVVRSRAELFRQRVRSADSVFEWGCGFGWNLAGLQCARRVGHDVAEQLRPDVESSGVEFALRPEEFPDGSFDVVISHHALEHISEPFRVLLGMRRLLGRAGRLLLAVPFEVERRYRQFDPREPNHHLFSWNVQTLGNLLLASGFDVRELGLRPYGYDRRAAILAVRFGGGEGMFRWIRSVLRRIQPIREIAALACPR